MSVWSHFARLQEAWEDAFGTHWGLCYVLSSAMGLKGATACVIFLGLQIVMLSRVRFAPRGFATREKTPYLPLGIQPGIQPSDPAKEIEFFDTTYSSEKTVANHDTHVRL